MMTNKQLQINLQFLNYYWGAIDGIIGEQTKNAIKRFQADYDLIVDGIFGYNTQSTLDFTIRKVQEMIGASVDGLVGNESVQKLKEFQAKYGLKVDGICGAETMKYIFVYNWGHVKHFKQSEFTCKCGCGLNNIDIKLVQVLDNIREKFDAPLIITSGVRCVNHNAKVGGVKGSTHTIGKASDFYIKGVSTGSVLNYCKELQNNGFIKYTYTNNNNMSGAVHINI